MKAVTVRLPESVVRQLVREAREAGVERGVVLREAVEIGLRVRREDLVLADYGRGDLSEEQACRKLELDRWGFLDLLARRGLTRNVGLDAWLDSRRL
jgi:predicted transcriptional regulator